MRDGIALRKAGITIVKELSILEVNKIASNISEKICASFPEYKINQSDLFIAISRVNMYLANFEDNSAAKYWYKNNSIYFKEDIDFNSLETPALHECLHFIQTQRNKNGKIQRLGLYNISTFKEHGYALNEAAVQLMAAYATNEKADSVKYYGMEFITTSPNYYPIECALVKQMTYFTGTYPLFHSTLYSNDIFKNTFIMKSNEDSYYAISKNLDKLVELEETLNKHTILQAYKNDHVDKIPKYIENLKQEIRKITIETQELILTSCAYSDLALVRDNESIAEFKKKLYRFKNVLIKPNDQYIFYNEFYCHMMEELEVKRELIKKYGILNCFKEIRENFALIEARPERLNLIQLAVKKFKKIFHIGQEEYNNN